MDIKRVKLHSYLGKNWRYYYQILKSIRNNEPLPIEVINEAGGRKCGKTFSGNVFSWLAIILFPNKTFTIYTIRLLQDKRKESYDEIIKVAPDAENVLWRSNKQQFIIQSPKNKQSQFRWQIVGMLDRGVKRGVQKLGLARFDSDYVFIIFEEASEFTEEQIHMVKNAFNLSDRTLLMFFGNPYFPHAPFFQNFAKYFPFPRDIMYDKNKGRAFKLCIAEGKKTLFQWTNIYSIVNEPYFSKNNLLELESGAKKLPLLGATSLYGEPLALAGAIYPEQTLRKIKYFTNPLSVVNIHDYTIDVWAGLDYGFTRDPSAFVWGFKDTISKKIFIMDAFKTSSSQAGEFDTLQFANQVYSFITQHVLKWLNLTKKQLTIWTDSHALGLTSSLNHQLPNHLKHIISFRSVSKKYGAPVKIINRIENVVNLMNTNRILMRTNSAGNQLLKEEWGASEWDKTATTYKRVCPDATGDHLQDAFEYGALG